MPFDDNMAPDADDVPSAMSEMLICQPLRRVASFYGAVERKATNIHSTSKQYCSTNILSRMPAR